MFHGSHVNVISPKSDNKKFV